MQKRKYFYAVVGLVLAVMVFFLIPGETHVHAPIMGAIATLMAVFWIFEVVPIPVTALFPLVLIPLFGIADVNSVGSNYGKSIIFLFLGGFLLALGLQKTGLHKRIAFHIVRIIGGSPGRLVLGFMSATWFLSMWISNTAAVLVMLPIGLSVISQISDDESDSLVAQKKTTEPGLIKRIIAYIRSPQELAVLKKNFAICLMLGIAYGANIGGITTPVGTPPNLVFLQIFSDLFPWMSAPGFSTWILFALPFTITFLLLGWFLLTCIVFRLGSTDLFKNQGTVEKEIKKLGTISSDEVLVGSIFLCTALLWITGSDLNFGSFTLTGWRTFTGLAMVNDAVVAVAMATILFLVPSLSRKGERILDWKIAPEIPWGVLLLFGGGFALASGFQSSGLSEVIAGGFENLEGLSPVAMVLVICISVTLLTEITSNTASTTLLLPILGQAAIMVGIDPRMLMIPATLSASCSFMMPVASPTQAIVFASGHVKIRDMVRAGIWFNLLGVTLISSFFLLYGVKVLGI